MGNIPLDHDRDLVVGSFESSIFFFFNFYLFIYFLAVLGLRFCARAFSLVAASGGHSSSRCAGLAPSRPLLLRSTGSRRAGSAVVAHGPSCSAACGILPDQGTNPCPLHWQADSQPLHHQGSPESSIFCGNISKVISFNLQEIKFEMPRDFYNEQSSWKEYGI